MTDENTTPVQAAPIAHSAVLALVEPLYADKQLATGEPFLQHAQGVVAILQPLRDDADLLAAAYLFGVPDVLRDADDWLRSRFGASVAQLVADLRVLMRVSERTRPRMVQTTAQEEGQAEALRKMLLAMVNDVRVVLLRLASRLQTLRWYAANKKGVFDAALREAIARETMELYAPLANRLGVWQLKWELEDLAFSFIEPETYKRIAKLLEEKRVERERFMEEAQRELRKLLERAGLQGEVSGRPKHIYSIWSKLRKKELAFDELYDVRGLRVIVDEVSQCYQVLALVHERWKALPDEFDDYIVKPKPNGYQSLHTVVQDDAGRTLEIQVRTQVMHALAELGVAAHWRYKESGSSSKQARAAARDDERVAWLRQLLAWREEVEGPKPQGAADERIYVLTPQGKVVELQAGATPIDFAYHLHTELGHRCRGARVDGAMVPLNTALATGQTVEIVAAKSGGPSRDWLNPELGFLVSARSRAKVRAWFNALELQQAVATGRAVVEKELARQGKTAFKLEELARRLGFTTVDDLFIAATKEEFSLRSIEQAVAEPGKLTLTDDVPPLLSGKPNKTAAAQGKGSVLVVGVDSLLTSLARCCRPVPPDEIVGFVTRGKGVSIHRADCVNAQALAARQGERLIEVAWGAAAGATYPVDLFVVAHDRHGLLRDVSEVFAREKLNVVGVNTVSVRGDAQMQFTVEVSDMATVRRVLSQITELPGVISTRRK